MSPTLTEKTEFANAVAGMRCVGTHVKHSDATGTIQLTLPAGVVLLWALAICTESAAGSPDVDFGVEGGDVDGIFDDLGANAATAGNTLGDDPDATGVGVLLQDDQDTSANKVPKLNYYAASTVFENVQNAAGTAGEWDVFLFYVPLPTVS